MKNYSKKIAFLFLLACFAQQQFLMSNDDRSYDRKAELKGFFATVIKFVKACDQDGLKGFQQQLKAEIFGGSSSQADDGAVGCDTSSEKVKSLKLKSLIVEDRFLNNVLRHPDRWLSIAAREKAEKAEKAAQRHVIFSPGPMAGEPGFRGIVDAKRVLKGVPGFNQARQVAGCARNLDNALHELPSNLVAELRHDVVVAVWQAHNHKNRVRKGLLLKHGLTDSDRLNADSWLSCLIDVPGGYSQDLESPESASEGVASKAHLGMPDPLDVPGLGDIPSSVPVDFSKLPTRGTICAPKST